MSNYQAVARTNAFQVKNEEEFLKEMASIKGLNVKKHEITNDGIQRYSLNPNYQSNGNWGMLYFEDDDEFDIMDIISDLLPDNEVCVFLEIGNDKLKYLVGEATAVNNQNARVDISLTDIYTKLNILTNAPELITRAEY